MAQAKLMNVLKGRVRSSWSIAARALRLMASISESNSTMRMASAIRAGRFAHGFAHSKRPHLPRLSWIAAPRGTTPTSGSTGRWRHKRRLFGTRTSNFAVLWRKRHKNIYSRSITLGFMNCTLEPKMPHAFKATPDYPAVAYLVRLHADIGGRLLDNKKEAAKLDAIRGAFDAKAEAFAPGQIGRA